MKTITNMDLLVKRVYLAIANSKCVFLFLKIYYERIDLHVIGS